MKKNLILSVCLLLVFTAVTPRSGTAGSVKIGVLPIVDALPFYVMRKQGLDKTLSMPVDLITFRSAIERDAAFQTGKIDAYLGDLVSATLMRSRGFPTKVVSVILGKTPQEGLFALLTPPNSPVLTLKDLKGKHVAISSNTIIEYVLDGLLKAHGLSGSDIKKQEIKSIPIRFQMLMSGKIDAAVLPDPLASLARFKGARWIADDGGTNLSQTVLVWNEAFLNRHPAFLRAFYRAYDQAVSRINRDHEKVRGLLVEKCRLPQPIAKTFKFADFPPASPVAPQSLKKVLAWMGKKGLLEHPVKTDDLLVNPKSLFPAAHRPNTAKTP